MKKIVFYHLIQILIFFTLNSKCENVDSLQLRITNDTLRVNNQKISLTLKLCNNDNKNYLLYAMKSFEESENGVKYYCNDTVPAGTAVFIEKDNEQVFPDITVSGPITLNDIHSLFKRTKRNYILNCVWVESKSTETISSDLNLKKFNLSKGKYVFYVIYFSGKYISNLVSDTRQLSDTDFFDAQIFKGYLVSNKVVLIVE